MKLGSHIQNIFTISSYTFREIIKSKILYNTVAIGIALLIITLVAFSFTYGDAARVALDFGLGALSLSSVGIAIFIGVGIIFNEMESRTIYIIISRPIKRYSFVIGKILGLAYILLINILILSVLTLSVYLFSGGELSPLIFWSILFIFIESLIVLVISILFSLLSTKALSVILTLSVYIAGHAIDGAKLLTFVKNRPFLEVLLESYQYVLPAFYKLNIKEFVIYKNTLSFNYLASISLYSFTYLIGALLLIIFIFNRKSLD